MQDRHLLGHPTESEDISQYKEIIHRRREAKIKGNFEAVGAIDRALDRLSSKSASLLQADSVIAAVLVITPPWAKNDTSDICIYINFIGFLCVLASCFLLLLNFLVVWAKDQTIYENPDRDFDFAYAIYRARASRLTFSLALTMAALVACAISYLAVPLIYTIE